MPCKRQLVCQVLSRTHYLCSSYNETIDWKKKLSEKGDTGALILKKLLITALKEKQWALCSNYHNFHIVKIYIQLLYSKWQFKTIKEVRTNAVLFFQKAIKMDQTTRILKGK